MPTIRKDDLGRKIQSYLHQNRHKYYTGSGWMKLLSEVIGYDPAFENLKENYQNKFLVTRGSLFSVVSSFVAADLKRQLDQKGIDVKVWHKVYKNSVAFTTYWGSLTVDHRRFFAADILLAPEDVIPTLLTRNRKTARLINEQLNELVKRHERRLLNGHR
jgi:hypothetical protein